MNHDIHVNPDMNYQILINTLSKAKLTHMPKTTRRYNKRKDKREKWMTNELLKQINKKTDMYVEWKTKSTTTEMYNNNKKINFKTFEKNSQYEHNLNQKIIIITHFEILIHETLIFYYLNYIIIE